ncbi:MAG: hypothetical protein KIT11_01185 [Fimbriimonadaceae bacterium]|nr:hypothetical protein [Fimbriimonadaceae bacterium]QYK55012.1 MAG: hypothetical protein KF733_08350 [Fimbriimonadaceae bacterium]
MQLAQDFVIGSTQTVGTVVMSQNVGSATVVQLETTDGSVTTPPTVTVPNGQKTATFTVTVDNPGGPVVAQVIAHTPGYSQRAKMAAVSAQGDLAITALEARSGKGGVWLGWTGFPEDVYGKTLPGYKILRKQGTGQFLQVGKVTDTAQFVDTTAAENTAYTYKVELRNAGGTLLAASPERTVTKTGGGATINWPPTGGTTWSGTKTVLLANPDPSQEHYDVYVNDRLYGTASATESNGGSSQTIRLDLDTTQLANSVDMSGGELNRLLVGGGTYKIVLSSTDEQTALHSSPPLYFNVSNELSSVSNDGVCQTGGSEYGAIQGTFREAGTTTIQLQSQAGQTLRTWTFDDRRFAIVWDGKDSQNNAVGDGSYKWRIEGTGGGGTFFYRIVKVGQSPQFLSIINYPANEPLRSEGIAYASRVAAYLQQMSQTTTSFSWLVYTLSENETVSRTMVQKICKWIRFSCDFFHLDGHGYRATEGQTESTAKIGANVYVRNFGSAVKGWSFITVPYWTQGRQYRFAWLDTCHSGGCNKSGVPADPWQTFMTRQPHDRWADAFNIDREIFEGAFLGFNGQVSFNGPSGPAKSYRDWRDFFWQALANGLTFREALTRADQRLVGNAPQPNPRSIWVYQQSQFPKRVTSGEYKW